MSHKCNTKVRSDNPRGDASLRWYFGKSGIREGFTASPITYFSGNRVHNTVRECIQNSLDAGTGDSEPVVVGFTLTEHSLTELPGLSKLKDDLRRTVTEEIALLQDHASQQEIDESEAVSFYNSALETLSKESLAILGIHDWGTTGLTGAYQEKQGVSPSPWLALIRGKGVDVKNSTDALGSFGQGANAPFSMSQLRTLFYLSRCFHDDKVQDRFIGKTILSSGWDQDEAGEDFLTSATGYFSPSADISPFINDELPQWAKSVRQGITADIGTSIFIPAPFDDGGPHVLEQSIVDSVMLNFYFAIEQGFLEVVLPSNQRLTKDNVRSYVITSDILTNDELDDDLRTTLTTLVNASGRWRGIKNSTTFGEVHYAISTRENLTEKRVGVARKTGMLITKRPPLLERFSGVANFDLFVCVTGFQGSKILRQIENPSHDHFEFDRITNPEKRASSLKSYKAFAEDVRKLINEYASIDSVKELLVDDLEELLGSGANDGEKFQGEKQAEFAYGVQVQSKARRKKQNSVALGANELGGFGGGGSKGKSKNKGGENPGEGSGESMGNKGSKMSGVIQPLLTKEEKSGKYIFYFTIPKDSSASRLALFESGETSIVPMRISEGEDGPLIGELPRQNWQRVGNEKENRFKIEFFRDQPILSLEAFTRDD